MHVQPTRAQPSPALISNVFHALSDPTRRSVLEQLSARASSVSELAARHEMALPSFVGHLKVLEKAGLVTSRKTGRVRTYELAPNHLRAAEDWLGRQRAIWEGRLDRLDAYLLAIHRQKQGEPR